MAKTAIPKDKPSVLVDARIIYWGANIELLKKLPDACVIRNKAIFVRFAFSVDATAEIGRFFKKYRKMIIPLLVRESFTNTLP